jgi:hypothetical protein
VGSRHPLTPPEVPPYARGDTFQAMLDFSQHPFKGEIHSPLLTKILARGTKNYELEFKEQDIFEVIREATNRENKLACHGNLMLN